jgi:DNA replication initiation complex subunit (GINS family)
MDQNIYEKYQKVLDDIEKKKKKSQVLEDHLKAAQLRHAQQIDYQKNNSLRRERTHRLVQKGALFEAYIEKHLEIVEHLTPEESELLLDVFSDILKKNKPYILKRWKMKQKTK